MIVNGKKLTYPESITGKYYPSEIFKLSDFETNNIWEKFYKLELSNFHFYSDCKNIINNLYKENNIILTTGKNNIRYYKFERKIINYLKKNGFLFDKVYYQIKD